jgi:CubicO group peptidase (beta-lactamase class C family)
MRKQHLPAMAVTVVRGEEVLYQGAKGVIDRKNQIPASTRSVFKLWSLAKPFTAMEIFREIEEDLVELEAPLTAYLPDFSIQSMYKKNDVPTIRDVLAHRAGLPRHEGLMPAGMVRDLNYLERFECGTASCYSSYPVATRYKYSNLGYDLLGRVIEESRSEGFFKHMKLNLLNDLGMKNADFYSGAIDSSLHRAVGYGYHKRKYTPYVQHDINNFPSGNLYATIEDLSAFLQSLFRGDLFNKENTLSRMLVNHYSHPGDPETMGLGWKLARMKNNEILVWHDGGPSEGTGSLIAFLPERKIGLAVIGNGTSFSGFYSLQFAMKILDSLMEEGSENRNEGNRKEKKANHSEPEAVELSTETIRDLEGSYAAFGSLAEVKLKGKHLKVRFGGLSLILVPVSDTDFRITHWMEKTGLTRIIKPPVDFTEIGVSFRKDGPGDYGSMIIHMMDVSHEVCPKYPLQSAIPEHWKTLCGSYQRADRKPGGTWETKGEGRAEIQLQEGILMMSGPYGPILPVNDTLMRVLSGAYHGEYLDHDPVSGVILHQKWAFLPVGG